MPNAKRQEFQEVMPAYVEAPVNYLADLSVTPVTYNPPAGTGIPKRVGNYRDFPVRIADGRPFAADMSLDRQAFRLVRHDTEVHDFYDTEEVKTRYYAEVAKAAEDHGFESLWVPEHLVLPDRMPPTYLYSDTGEPPIRGATQSEHHEDQRYDAEAADEPR